MQPIHGKENIADYLGCHEDTLDKYVDKGLKMTKIGNKFVAIDVDLIKFIRSQYGKWQSNPTNVATSTGSASQIPTETELESLLGLHQKEKRPRLESNQWPSP